MNSVETNDSMLQKKIEIAKGMLAAMLEARAYRAKIDEMVRAQAEKVIELEKLLGEKASVADVVEFFGEHKSEIGIDDEELDRMKSAFDKATRQRKIMLAMKILEDTAAGAPAANEEAPKPIDAK